MEPRRVEAFWEAAGEAGHRATLFPSPRVAAYALGRRWDHALEMAHRIGIPAGGAVLDLGCGDGEFACEVLAPRFGRVDAVDRSRAAIARAAARPGASRVRFEVRDLVSGAYAPGDRWDGAFLLGVLSYLRPAAPTIVARLAGVAPRVVVIEPNGDHPARRWLERRRVLRRAGGGSFRLRELVEVFAGAGYRLRACRGINLFLAFLPDVVFPLMAQVERWVEARPVLHGLCSTRVLGFVRDP